MFLTVLLTFLLAAVVTVLLAEERTRKRKEKIDDNKATKSENTENTESNEMKTFNHASVKILYASSTGRAQRFAQQLHEQLSKIIDCQIHSIQSYDPEDLFTETATVILVASTVVDAGPPETGKWFYGWLEEAVNDFRIQKDALAHLRFAVFGCGDSAYGPELFNRVARNMHGWLRALSAKAICPVGLADASGDGEDAFKSWSCEIGAILGDPARLAKALEDAQLPAVLFETESEEEDDEQTENKVGCGNRTVGDLEDIVGVVSKKSYSRTNSKEVKRTNSKEVKERTNNKDLRTNSKEMVTPTLNDALTKQGYKIIGSHSGVKLCRWTKSMLRGRGGCYKHSFYGIESHRCMETTPSLACANKCFFCWRHHTNPVGTEWRWKIDDPQVILQGALGQHQRMIRELRGLPGVQLDRFQEAMDVRHCALSLVGEPIMYPHINEFVGMLHERSISSFLVTNAQFPDRIAQLAKVTQLYVSIDAGTKEALRQIDRPLFGDFWERFLASLDALRESGQRTVYRLTLVKAYNTDELASYAELIRRGRPDFVEVKGVTFCGYTGSNPLTMANVPFHHEVVQFVRDLGHLVGSDGYEIACEHAHSCSVLMAHRRYRDGEGSWKTWIDYDRFHQLLRQGRPFGPLDYAMRTPDWAVYGHEQHGFDPKETRFYRKKKKDTIDHGC